MGFNRQKKSLYVSTCAVEVVGVVYLPPEPERLAVHNAVALLHTPPQLVYLSPNGFFFLEGGTLEA